MSWDVYLTIDTGGPHPAVVAEAGNHTSNTSGMWNLAWRNAYESHGWFDSHNEGSVFGWVLGDYLATGPEAHWTDYICLAYITDEMLAHPERYREMNPSNGWGSYESALRFLFNIRLACTKHPNARIKLSR